MNGTNDPGVKSKSWLDRLNHLLSREPTDRAGLLKLLYHLKQRQVLDEDSLHMIEGVLEVSQMQVREAMIPRAQMVILDAEATPKQVLQTIFAAGHSRYPVMGEGQDEIEGILLAKDLLPYIGQEQKIQIRQLVRPATFIPESKRLNVLLKEFRLNRNHMAIVVDEYGGISGLITIEDVLEEIVGEIQDEYDKTIAPLIKKIDQNEYIVNALLPIYEFNEYFKTEFSEEDADTIGGLVLQKLSHLPKRGETVTIEPFQITVIEASKRGIQQLRIRYSGSSE